MECEIEKAIEECVPVIHSATVGNDEIEYECILGTYPLKNGIGVILKSGSGNSVTYAKLENVRIKT